MYKHSGGRPSDPLIPFGGYPKLEHSCFDFKMKVIIISTFQSTVRLAIVLSVEWSCFWGKGSYTVQL